MDPDFHLYRLVRLDGTGKEWGYRINADGTVTTQWRKAFVAAKFQINTRRIDGIKLDALIRSKERKGYRPVSAIPSPGLHPIPETREPESHRQSMKEWMEELQPSLPKINELIDGDKNSLWF